MVPFKLIDLFCGAGCFSLGFSSEFDHPFVSVWANDVDTAAAASYKANFGHCTPGDIAEVLKDGKTKIPPAEVVIGGPPCQGFSLLNKNRQGDPRKQLWRPFFEIVKRSGALIFVMENVPQLLGSNEHTQIVRAAEQLGFKVRSQKLLAANYGVPQIRERAFILGCQFSDPKQFFPPAETHFNPLTIPLLLHLPNGFKPWRTVRDAIGDLPLPVGTEIRHVGPPLNLHFHRTPTPTSIERYKTIPEEGMNRFDLQRLRKDLTPPCWIRKKTGGTDLFGRLWWDRPAYTIRTEFFKPEKGRYLHPAEHRPITHREAARLQSIPDQFQFRGTKTEIARQIGNAVPPLLAARVADCVVALLGGREAKSRRGVCAKVR